jgi:uncharacterized protein YbjQ (UPF0145 family)
MTTATTALAVSDPYRMGVELNRKVIVTTGNDVAGYDVVAYLGVVRGLMVRSTGFKKSFVGAFRSLRAGNVKEYVDVCEAARHEAYTQMVAHAEELGADAIIGMRYDATEFMGGTTEVLAYGTAVRTQQRV